MKTCRLNLLFLLSIYFFAAPYQIFCAGESLKSVEAISKRSEKFVNVLLDMMQVCDNYLDYCKKKGEGLDNILFLENKKKQYAALLGKLYKSVEIVSQLSADTYKKEQLDSLNHLRPPVNKNLNVFKYSFAAGVAAAAVLLVYKNRKNIGSLKDHSKRFLNFHVVEPLISLKDYFFSDYTRKTLDISSQECESQRKILLSKVKDFVLELNPDANQQEVKKMVALAGKSDIEGFVFRFLKQVTKGEKLPAKRKKGWVDWLLANKINHLIGMTPRAKILELEIKGLLTRLSATKMMIDASQAMDSNRLTLILGSMIPAALVSSLAYLSGNKVYSWLSPSKKKKQEINKVIGKIRDLLRRNLGGSLSYQDQGFLCYYVSQLRSRISVIHQSKREDFDRDLSDLESCLNSVESKLLTLKCMKLSLYS